MATARKPTIRTTVRRGAYIGFRVSEDERQLLIARARTMDLPLSIWLRRELLGQPTVSESRAA